MTDHPPIRAHTCPQCGAPLASMVCAYCGSTMVYKGGHDGRLVLDTSIHARTLRDAGAYRSPYMDPREDRWGLP